jgi:hypothetical protein
VARPRPRGDWIGGWLPARQSGWRRGLREGPRKDHTRSSACNATRPDLRLCVLCNLAVAPIGTPPRGSRRGAGRQTPASSGSRLPIIDDEELTW